MMLNVKQFTSFDIAYHTRMSFTPIQMYQKHVLDICFKANKYPKHVFDTYV